MAGQSIEGSSTPAPAWVRRNGKSATSGRRQTDTSMSALVWASTCRRGTRAAFPRFRFSRFCP